MASNEIDEDRICDLLRANDPYLGRLLLQTPRVVHCSPSFEQFLEALHGNASVRTVYVGELIVQTTTEEQLNLLLSAIAHVETLEALEVAMPHVNEQKKISAATLATLLRQARNLKTVVIWPFVQLTQEGITTIAEVLRDNTHLETLALMNVLLPAGQAAASLDPILNSVATLSKLETLQLSAGLRVQSESHPIGVDALANLVENGNLKFLALRNFGLEDAHGQRLADTLTHHHGNIKNLDVSSNSMTKDGYKAFRDMLDGNYNIESLETDMVDAKMQREMNFLLLLNRAGRYILFKDASATTEQCIEVFSKTEDDLDATYYLLRSHPNLCDSKKDA